MLNTNELKNAVNALNKVVPQKTSMPVLQTVLMQSANGQVRLTANNLNMSLSMLISENDEYDTCIPSKTIAELLSTVNSQEIRIEQGDGEIIVYRQTGKTKLRTMNSIEFPVVHNDTSNGIAIDSQILKSALTKVMPAVGSDKDSKNTALAGIYLKSADGVMLAAGADGFRLAIIESMIGLPDFEVIIPYQSAIVLTSILDLSSVVQFKVDESRIYVFSESYYFTSQLTAGKYPDVKRVVPTSFKTTVQIDKAILQAAIKTALIFAREQTTSNLIDIEIGGDYLEIKGESAESGSDVTRIECNQITGNPIRLAVNGLYLSEFVKLATNDVILRFTEPVKPIGIFIPEDKMFTGIIMPMHKGK